MLAFILVLPEAHKIFQIFHDFVAKTVIGWPPDIWEVVGSTLRSLPS